MEIPGSGGRAPSPPANPAVAAPRPAHLPVRLRPCALKVSPDPPPSSPAPAEVALEDALRRLLSAWRGVAGSQEREELPVPRGQDFRQSRKTFSLAVWRDPFCRPWRGRFRTLPATLECRSHDLFRRYGESSWEDQSDGRQEERAGRSVRERTV